MYPSSRHLSHMYLRHFSPQQKIWEVIEFFTIRITVRLSVRSKVTQNKINFVKNCTQWSLNSQPPDYQSHALPTVLGRNLLEIAEVSFLLFQAPLPVADLREGCEGRTPPPPLAQNFFIFMQFSGKIGQIIGWCPPFGVSAPFSGKSWIHH